MYKLLIYNLKKLKKYNFFSLPSLLLPHLRQSYQTLESGNNHAGMTRLVQVKAEQAQIPEEDATKARDSNFGDRDPEEVASKAHNPDTRDRDLEEILAKSRNPDSIYHQCCEHEGAQVLAVVSLFVVAIIARKIVEIARLCSLSPPASKAPILSLIFDSTCSRHETPDRSILSLSPPDSTTPIASRSSVLSCSRSLNSEPFQSTFPYPRVRLG